MYYFALFLLVICSLSEVFYKQPPKILFVAIYVLITLMAIFRFGQLGDYFDYYYLYQNPLLLRDPLFIIYASTLRLVGFDYQGFVTITELICMGLAFPFFYKTCKYSFISLLAFYCYTYMVCPMSALRQAVCLSMLLYSYSLLVDGKKILFYAMVILGCFIHLSFFSVFLIGILYDKEYFNHPMLIFAVLFSALLMFVGVDFFASFRGMFSDRSVTAAEVGAFDNLIQLALRLLIVLPVFFFNPDYRSDGYYAKAICIVGFILYCLLASNLLIAGRIEFFYRTFICLFIAYLSYSYKSILRDSVLLLLISVHVVLFFKNIGAAISQGDYVESVTVYNFPYISIFDKSEIDKYTTIDKYNYAE